jgi:GxxExxY protein
MLIQKELTGEIIGAAIEVHRVLGPGLLESAYGECLCHELALRHLRFERQVPVPVRYKGLNLDCAYRLDVLVEGSVIVEIKSVDALIGIHQAQLLTYMKITQKPVGLLINFNKSILKDGVIRKVLKEVLRASATPL